MKNQGVAGKIREAAKGFGRPFSQKELLDQMGLPKEQRAYAAKSGINDFLQSGEFRRVSLGVYEYAPRPRTMLDVIWHLIRSHRQFDAAEIERLSGAKLSTVHKFLQALTELGYLRKEGFYHWALVRDTGPETPRNIVKRAARSRRERCSV